MRYIIILLLISTTGSFAQDLTLKGKIIDNQTQEPISYAYLIIYNSNKATICDSLGNFVIEVPSVYSKGQLLVSRVGYKDTIVNISKENVIISLQPKVIQLDEIVVKNITNPVYNIGCKKTNFLFNSLTLINQGGGGGYWLYFPFNKRAAIKSVGFYISEIKGNEILVNLRILKPDTTYKTYGTDLLDDNLLVQPTKTGWTTFDLSKYNISVPADGFIIVIGFIGKQLKYKSTKELLKQPHITINCTKEKVDYRWLSFRTTTDCTLMGFRPAVKVYIQEK